MKSYFSNYPARWRFQAFALFLITAFFPALGAAPDYKSLPGSFHPVDPTPTPAATPSIAGPTHARPFISRRTLQANEQAASLQFEVALKMRDFAGLQARIAQGERISTTEMADKYDPTAADYAKVIAWLKSEGFVITRQDKNRLAVFARGKISRIQKSMQMTFARVTADNQEYTSGISAPSVPAGLADLIVGVNGLQPHLRAHKGLTKPASLTGTGAPYIPSQIAHVYQADRLYQSNITGAGQTIAIVIDTFPASSDLTGFWQTYGVNQSLSNISFIQAVQGTLPAPDGEETLDVEWSSAMAPGAKVRVYASVDLSDANLDQVYQEIYQDVTTHPEYGLHQVSLSYGEGETYTTSSQVMTDSQYFANLAAAGVTVFASAGDGTAFPNQIGTSEGGTRVEQALTPASDPNVTGVGGTTLQLDGNGEVSSETGWAYSGGGPSLYFPRPSWQIGPGSSGGSQRVTPDVASAADPEYGAAYYLNGGQETVGGTSWSSPMWAGFCALLNQARANASLPSLGVLGPKIYPLIGTSNFRDITSGSNGFPCLPGYDAVTGLGVPNLQTLAQTLVAPPVASTYTRPPTQIVHSFNDGDALNDGQTPQSLMQATDGNFYGITDFAALGYSSPGTLFKITAAGGLTTLQSFNVSANLAAGVTQDASGNLYATTNGTITKTTPQGVSSTFYTFPEYGGTAAPLVEGVDGNLYGITSSAHFFSISPQGVYTDIATLSNFETEAGYTMIRGNDGNFYGTTQFGGVNERGMTYEITPQGVLTVLHEFGLGNLTSEGTEPNSLVQAADGTFYGTTIDDNSAMVTGGTIFKMTPQGQTTLLHSFIDGGIATDGSYPRQMAIGADGNLYGLTNEGGTNGTGIVFELTLGAQNVYSILHNFGDGSVANDGNNGVGLVRGADGNVYGITAKGGTNDGGTFFVVDYITSAPAATFTAGFAGSFNVTTAGMTSATLHATGLPSWATLNASTGVLSGTPPDTSGSPFAVTITTSNGGATPTIVQNFVLTVVPPAAPVFTSAVPTATATLGTSYAFTCQASGFPVPGGFTVTSGALPPGLSLSSDGAITGTPTASGLYTGTITVTNGVGAGATQNFSIGVQQITAFTSAPLNAVLTVGTAFNFTLTATGYPPATFSLNGGGLPAGLTLSDDGTISGTPTGGWAGVYTGTFYAYNNYGTYGSSAQQDFTLTVDEAPSINVPPAISPTLVNTSYYYDFTQDATGYPAATYALTSGAFPPGLTMTDGLLTGTTTTTGTFTGVVTASNGIGTPATKAFTIVVQNATAPVFTNVSSATATVGVPFNFQFMASGLPAATYTMSSDPLPPGVNALIFSYYPPNSNQVATVWTGSLNGTPTQAGTYNFTVTASNGTSPDAVQNFTITVAQPDYNSWCAQYFSTQPASATAPAATPMGDSVPNLLKYAFDIDPTQPMSTVGRASLPALGLDTTTTPGTQYLTLTYRKNYYATGLHVNVQTSTDLQTWQTVTPDISQETIGQPGVINGQYVSPDTTMKVGVKVNGIGPTYVRLNVSQ